MLDLFIIVVILWSLYNGWRAGFIREALSTTGLLTGLLGASFVYSALGDTLVIATGNPINMVTNIIAFFLLWIIIPLVLGFAATLLTKMLGKLHLGSLNSAAGAALSFIKYLCLLSCILTAMHSLGILNEERVQKSVCYPPVSDVLSWAVDAVFAESNDASTDSSHQRPTSSNAKDSNASDTVWVQRNGSIKK